MLIKICGLTNLEDALAALEFGANALGFVFYPPSPRNMTESKVNEIIKQLPPGVETYAVFTTDYIPDLGDLECSCLQVHGLKDPSFFSSGKRKLLVATTLAEHHLFPNAEIIIDESMGRGITADWQRLRQIQRPFVLSGGLGPDNIAEALRTVHPAGVDVSSGVEAAKGKKDLIKLENFINEVKKYQEEKDVS